MTDVATALSYFWNGFGLPAFVEGTVPDKMPEELHVRNVDGTPVIFERDAPVKMPYITYRLAKPDWITPVSMYARLWYKSTSFRYINAKVDEIEAEIDAGAVISLDKGTIWLYKESPFSQFMENDDPDVKCIYLNLSMQAVTE